MPDQTHSKTSLRTTMRARRRRLDPAQRLQAGYQVLQHARSKGLIAASRRLAAYIPWDGEVDTTPLISYAWSVRASVWLPVVPALSQRRLQFAPFHPRSELAPDRYGIPTPKYDASELISARNLDLLLLPLVAFDRSGGRLGMGAGYYDATLDFLRHRRYWHQPRIIGVGYSMQEVDGLPRAAWDVSLHGILTDAEFIPVQQTVKH